MGIEIVSLIVGSWYSDWLSIPEDLRVPAHNLLRPGDGAIHQPENWHIGSHVTTHVFILFKKHTAPLSKMKFFPFDNVSLLNPPYILTVLIFLCLACILPFYFPFPILVYLSSSFLFLSHFLSFYLPLLPPPPPTSNAGSKWANNPLDPREDGRRH
jgi:hypothetical protein